MNSSAYLIYNPIAGQGNAEQDLAMIQHYLHDLDLQVYQTTPEVDADQLAGNAVASGASLIIASGGDGTLSLAASALVGTEIPFGVIPRGTANALAAALGISDEIEDACRIILANHRRAVDAATCNDQPMLLLAGVGFEAETVEQADRETKDRFGTLAYVIAGIQQLGAINPFKTILETEERIIEVTSAAVTVANIAPPTSVLAQGPDQVISDDGLLDITIVAPGGIGGAISASYQLFRTALDEEAVERDDVGYFRAKSVTITTDPPQKVVIDGELSGMTPIVVKSIPQGLTIIVPATSTDRPLDSLVGLPDLKIQHKSLESDTQSSED